MIRMILTPLALLVMTYSTFAQAAESSGPLLTRRLLEQIDPVRDSSRTPAQQAADAMTEADALKLLPVTYRLAPAPADTENDWVIICAETSEIVIEFTDGKLSSRSASFHPAVTSGKLTLERFRELKDGMTKEDVEKLFGEELSRIGSVKRVGNVDRWRYVRGRELEVYIANHKVTGAVLKAYQDK